MISVLFFFSYDLTEVQKYLLSKVQNMRKDKGFEVLDRINLYVADNKMLEAVVEKFADKPEALKQ